MEVREVMVVAVDTIPMAGRGSKLKLLITEVAQFSLLFAGSGPECKATRCMAVFSRRIISLVSFVECMQKTRFKISFRC